MRRRPLLRQTCACATCTDLTNFRPTSWRSTPLGSLPLARWTYDAHQSKILEGLEAVDQVRTLPGREFVFVHVLAPHPPFVLSADGRAVQARRPFDIGDGDDFRGDKGEYIPGVWRSCSISCRSAPRARPASDRPGGAGPGDHHARRSRAWIGSALEQRVQHPMCASEWQSSRPMRFPGIQVVRSRHHARQRGEVPGAPIPRLEHAAASGCQLLLDKRPPVPIHPD